MNEYIIQRETLEDIGNSLRALTDNQNLLSPTVMAQNLNTFQTETESLIEAQNNLIEELTESVNSKVVYLQTAYNNLLGQYHTLMSSNIDLETSYQHLLLTNKLLEAQLKNEQESWAGELTFTSTSSTKYNTSEYYTEAGCSLAVDKQKGMAFVTIQGGTTTANEKIYFVANSLPEGVTMQSYNQYFYGSTGNTKDYYTVGLTGITGKINVVVDFNGVNSTYDYTKATLTVTYANDGSMTE